MTEILANINQCIYCGEKTALLTNEHIVPFALHGEWVLVKASCEKCQKITSKFERNVCKSFLPSPRSLLKFPTRRIHPSKFQITLEKENGEEIIYIPVEEYGGVISFLTFQPPAFFNTHPYENGITIVANQLCRIGGMGILELAKKYNARAVTFNCSYSPTDFARMIAKIAFGFAVAKYGLGNFKPYVLPAILGQKDDIGMWVGCEEPSLGNPTEDFFVHPFVKKGIIFCRMVFFGRFEEVPVYVVVVGKLVRNI